MTPPTHPPHVMRWARSSPSAAARFQAANGLLTATARSAALGLIPPAERLGAARRMVSSTTLSNTAIKALRAVLEGPSAHTQLILLSHVSPIHTLVPARAWARWILGGRAPDAFDVTIVAPAAVRRALLHPADAWAERERIVRGEES